MNRAGVGKIVRVASAVLTGAIALSWVRGRGWSLGGGISVGETIDTRLPFRGLLMSAQYRILAVFDLRPRPGLHHASVPVGGGRAVPNRGWAAVLAPVMFVLGAVLIFSLALGELMKPAFGWPITIVGLLPTTLLTALFVALAVLHLKKLTFRPSAHPPTEPGRSSQSYVNNPPAEMATGSDRQQPSQPGSAG